MRSGCQATVSIVVMPFTGAEVPEADLKAITQLFEDSLPRFDSLQVIDQAKRARVLAYLDPSLLTCADAACSLRAAKALAADLVVLGTVARRSDALVIEAEAINVKSGRTGGKESVEAASQSDLPRILRILSSTLLATTVPQAFAAAAPEDEEEALQKRQALESMRATLNLQITEIKEKRAKAQRWGGAFAGRGAVSAGLSGVCWYLSDAAYAAYQSTSDTDLAAYYRRKVTLWDTLFLVSAGTGVLSIGVSVPFFALGPTSRAEEKELAQVESELLLLESPGETD